MEESGLAIQVIRLEVSLRLVKLEAIAGLIFGVRENLGTGAFLGF